MDPATRREAVASSDDERMYIHGGEVGREEGFDNGVSGIGCNDRSQSIKLRV